MKKLMAMGMMATLSLCIFTQSVNAAETPKTVTAQTVSAEQSRLININTATESQLSSLKGIGAKKAKAIIDFRDSIGGFKSVDELEQVKGIGSKMVTRLRDQVTL
ncbi:ComEA family DNA-binding protein [Alteromonas oceanisediminis]|uniref:ComEA family DNA-binding protein n=1 Tax=Alteromonas oceanisediminis TaxID=2836180 RepID=UPI001BDA9E57|nr:ComEA family DNA-binding protein [Alteromonas oceanisediminis]MBT0585032.1 ComEA family DNA-binding protein [Alteromonas oceanisediminis]